MTSRAKVIIAIGAAIGLMALCCVGGTITYFLGGLQGTPSDPANTVNDYLACGSTTQVSVTGKLPDISTLSGEQVKNAAIIIKVGQDRKVPPRGWVIAIATALQESTLHNYGDLGARNDHDSLGLFQQRPSMGWGTPAQIMDPSYAAGKFYAKLVKIPGWETMPLTRAAQRVQVSAYPDAYAKHEPLATEIVNQLANGAALAVGSSTNLHCATGTEIAASGWTVPVVARISSGWRTPDRPTHNGVDLAAARGTPIRAAASGIVIVAECNAHLASGAWYGCDRDGSLQVVGCGWWVEIRHADNVITRYCHMGSRPDVVVGQEVTAGQVIGQVGATGNVSGPHLHFEVHVNGDASYAGAVDPVTFMRQRGAPVGVVS